MKWIYIKFTGLVSEASFIRIIINIIIPPLVSSLLYAGSINQKYYAYRCICF